MRVQPVDLVDPRRPDRLAIGLEHPEHVGLGLADHLEEAFLLFLREGEPAEEVARHLEVGEPTHEARGIRIVRRAKSDLRARQHGTVHLRA